MTKLAPISWKHQNITTALETHHTTTQLALEDMKKVVETVNSFFGSACDICYSTEVEVTSSSLGFYGFFDDSVDPIMLNETVEAFLEAFKCYNFEIVRRPPADSTISFFGSDAEPAWRLYVLYSDKETARQYTLTIALRIPSWSTKWKVEYFDDQQKFTWWKATRK
ncbi:MAG: hypothetical protein IPK54_10225 [Dokdonella sp.]|uniref:hypothetical protein n=1 Tax=Dokdonella sp. TaxID=2291710 RepID=UPI0025BB004F|nr:hypothetical protein [Dokdonella sp.]MBK8123908.1 hypothetical protein [Dokdonella sp.]